MVGARPQAPKAVRRSGHTGPRRSRAEAHFFLHLFGQVEIPPYRNVAFAKKLLPIYHAKNDASPTDTRDEARRTAANAPPADLRNKLANDGLDTRTLQAYLGTAEIIRRRATPRLPRAGLKTFRSRRRGRCWPAASATLFCGWRNLSITIQYYGECRRFPSQRRHKKEARSTAWPFALSVAPATGSGHRSQRDLNRRTPLHDPGIDEAKKGSAA